MSFTIFALGTPEWESRDLDFDHTVSYLEDKTDELCDSIGSMIMQAEDLLLDVVSKRLQGSDIDSTQL